MLRILSIAVVILLAGWAVMSDRFPVGGQAYAQSSLAPKECVCSSGLPLGGVAGGSLLRNCQCGTLQCVVVTGSGQLQCH